MSNKIFCLFKQNYFGAFTLIIIFPINISPLSVELIIIHEVNVPVTFDLVRVVFVIVLLSEVVPDIFDEVVTEPPGE